MEREVSHRAKTNFFDYSTVILGTAANAKMELNDLYGTFKQETSLNRGSV